MLNWPKPKQLGYTLLPLFAVAAVFAVTEYTGTRAFGAGHGSSALLNGSRSPASVEDDFKFPIVLCRFKQAVLKDTATGLNVAIDQDWGPEQAYPVTNVHAMSTRGDNGQMVHVIDGEFTGTYSVPRIDPKSPEYQLEIKGSIHQGADSGSNHQMRFAAFLQKKDAAGKWVQVGQSHSLTPALTQADGTVWENVYPYTFNSLEMTPFVENDKINHDKLVAGIRDGVLTKGSVFKVGPACGFLDARTAKSVASAEDLQRYKTIFDHIAAAPAPAAANTTLVAQSELSAEKRVHESLTLRPEKAPEKTEDHAEEKVAENREPINPPDAYANQGLNGAPQLPSDPSLVQAQAQQPAILSDGTQMPQAAVQAQAQAEEHNRVEIELAQQNQLADQAAAAYNAAQRQNESGMPAAVDARDPASVQAEQFAQSMQAGQTPEQIQQRLSALEQQRANLEQQQAMLQQMQADAATAQAAAQAAQQALADPNAGGAVQPALPTGKAF